MHHMNSMRDSFITPQRVIENFHYPGYVIRLQKERRLQAKRKKIERKICPKTVSQPINIRLFIKNIENLRLHFIKLKTIVNQMTPIIEKLWKENKNLQKKGRLCKNHECIMKTGCTKQKDLLRKIKPLWRANCISIDKWLDLSLEMLNYKLTSLQK